MLATLVDARHLHADAIEHARRRMAADRFGSVVIDDFLQPALVAGLLACFERDGDFRPYHSLKQVMETDGSSYEEHGVSEAEFDAAPEGRRLARELLMATDLPEDDGSDGRRAHLAFIDMLGSVEFKTFLAAITGATELNDVTYMARIMRHGDVCCAHSDAGDGRNLCLLLYIGDEWRPAFGGRFQNVENGAVARSTAPLGNRLILHRPAADQIHQVEAIGEAGRRWRRNSYSAWFGSFPESG